MFTHHECNVIATLYKSLAPDKEPSTSDFNPRVESGRVVMAFHGNSDADRSLRHSWNALLRPRGNKEVFVTLIPGRRQQVSWVTGSPVNVVSIEKEAARLEKENLDLGNRIEVALNKLSPPAESSSEKKRKPLSFQEITLLEKELDVSRASKGVVTLELGALNWFLKGIRGKDKARMPVITPASVGLRIRLLTDLTIQPHHEAGIVSLFNRLSKTATNAHELLFSYAPERAVVTEDGKFQRVVGIDERDAGLLTAWYKAYERKTVRRMDPHVCEAWAWYQLCTTWNNTGGKPKVKFPSGLHEQRTDKPTGQLRTQRKVENLGEELDQTRAELARATTMLTTLLSQVKEVPGPLIAREDLDPTDRAQAWYDGKTKPYIAGSLGVTILRPASTPDSLWKDVLRFTVVNRSMPSCVAAAFELAMTLGQTNLRASLLHFGELGRFAFLEKGRVVLEPSASSRVISSQALGLYDQILRDPKAEKPKRELDSLWAEDHKSFYLLHTKLDDKDYTLTDCWASASISLIDQIKKEGVLDISLLTWNEKDCILEWNFNAPFDKEVIQEEKGKQKALPLPETDSSSDETEKESDGPSRDKGKGRQEWIKESDLAVKLGQISDLLLANPAKFNEDLALPHDEAVFQLHLGTAILGRLRGVFEAVAVCFSDADSVQTYVAQALALGNEYWAQALDEPSMGDHWWSRDPEYKLLQEIYIESISAARLSALANVGDSSEASQEGFYPDFFTEDGVEYSYREAINETPDGLTLLVKVRDGRLYVAGYAAAPKKSTEVALLTGSDEGEVERVFYGSNWRKLPPGVHRKPSEPDKAPPPAKEESKPKEETPKVEKKVPEEPAKKKEKKKKVKKAKSSPPPEKEAELKRPSASSSSSSSPPRIDNEEESTEEVKSPAVKEKEKKKSTPTTPAEPNPPLGEDKWLSGVNRAALLSKFPRLPNPFEVTTQVVEDCECKGYPCKHTRIDIRQSFALFNGGEPLLLEKGKPLKADDPCFAWDPKKTSPSKDGLDTQNPSGAKAPPPYHGDRLKPELLKQLIDVLHIDTGPLPENYNELSLEERKKIKKSRKVPKWATAAVSADPANLEKIRKGEITAQTKGLQGAPRSALLSTKGTANANKTVGQMWNDLKKRFPGVPLWRNPRTKDEKALKGAFDALRKQVGPKASGSLPNPRYRPASYQGPTGGQGTSTNPSSDGAAGLSGTLGLLLDLAKGLGGIVKALKGD